MQPKNRFHCGGRARWGRHWWTDQQLPAPSKLIKTYITKSDCFSLVDRGSGMDAAMRERALAADGELRGKSNVGKGQIKAADYVLVPDLVSSNSNAGGSSAGVLMKGLVGGKKGALLAGLNLQTKTADVVLTVTDVRSSNRLHPLRLRPRKLTLGSRARVNCLETKALGKRELEATPTRKLGRSLPWLTFRPTQNW